MLDDIPERPDPRVMQGVIPYLGMRGRAAKAADFYIKAFAAKDLGRMDGDSVPGMPGAAGTLMHVQVEITGGSLMMTDYFDPAEPATTPMTGGHLQIVSGDGQKWWDRAVAAGCTVVSPYERQGWGDDWGLLVDPFGVRWAILQPGPQT